MNLNNLIPSQCTASINWTAGQNQSATLDTIDSVLVAIRIVNAWTAATISLSASWDGASFFPLFSNVAATQTILVPAADVLPNNWILLNNVAGIDDFHKLPRWLIFQSGTAAAPVAQVGANTVQCILLPNFPWDLAQ